MGQRTRTPQTLWDEWMIKSRTTLNNSDKVADNFFSVTIYDSLLYIKLQRNILRYNKCTSDP